MESEKTSIHLHKESQADPHLGKLKIFFGMASGVGKTYAMLQEAQQHVKEGVHVVIGTVNAHGRQEVEKLTEGIPVIAEKWREFQDKAFKELDLDQILEIKPQLVLVDDLAYSNMPGAKHPKRWQDVIEILDAGIDVYTTLNVYHLESRKEMIEGIIGFPIQETVPDLILERASAIEIIDIPPAELLERLKEGKVYVGDQPITDYQRFFQEDHLTALREIALRFTAEKVDHDLHGILALGKGWKIRERLMVAINAVPSSQHLIRSARLLAFEFDAPWIVVYVDNGKKLTEEEQTRLNKHFQLAHELGAEVITTYDLDVADALLHIAKQKNITRLVIGRPTQQSFWQRIFKKNLVDRLSEENKQIDILILRQDKLVSLYKQTLPDLPLTSSLSSYWTAIGAILGASLLGYLSLPWMGYKTVGYFFLISILLLSLFVGRGPLLLAATLSALIWDVLFIPPTFTIGLKNFSDVILVLIYFFTALIVGILNTRIRERDFFLNKREEKNARLYDIMQEMAKSPNFQYLRINVCEKLKQLFEGEFDILTKGKHGQLILEHSLPILNEEIDREAAQWCFRQGKMAGWTTDTLSAAKGLYFPIKYAKIPISVLAFYSKNFKPLSLDEMNFLQTVTEQLAIYLERYLFEERIQTQNSMRQIERVYLAIFRSLSKGFYAPLDKIVSINQKLKQVLQDKEEAPLIHEMDQASRNLKMIVDNILMISQLESGFIKFEKKEHSIKTLIEDALQEVYLVLDHRPVHINLPLEQNLVFHFDFHLLKTALKNILINSFEYSPVQAVIEIHVQILEKEFKISVTDEGPGISQEILPFIFEKFYHTSESNFQGIGLGLTIVKAVVNLHQGQLEVKNRDERGTEFSLILPK